MSAESRREDTAARVFRLFSDSRVRTAFALFILLLLAFAYNSPSCRCFFFADDFLVLDYMYKIFHKEPQIFLERLVSPWQDSSISSLYRPFCDIVFGITYACFGAKALPFHIVNLLLHGAVVLLLFVFLKDISLSLGTGRTEIQSFMAAAIFAVYPLHVEPLVWLVGISDLLATAFLLASLILYWRSLLGAKKWNFLSLFFCFLALLSKESAACLPLLAFLLVFMLARDSLQFRVALARSLPYFLVTGAYFVLRFSVLGTFLGGYNGSLGQWLLNAAQEGFRQPDLFLLLGHSVNLALFSENSREVLFLKAMFFILALLLLLRIPFCPWDKQEARILLFFLAAAFVALLPAFQVLGLSGVLSNGRIFYLGSAFYLPLMVFAVIPMSFSSGKMRTFVFIMAAAILALLACVYGCISYISYEPWIAASKMLLRLQYRLNYEVRQPGKEKVVVLNYAGNHRGAHLLYEFLELKSLLGPNFFKNSRSDRLMALDEYPDFVSASSKRLERLLRDSRNYRVLYFNRQKEILERVSSPPAGDILAEPVLCKFREAESLNENCRAYFVELSQKSCIGDGTQLELELDKSFPGFGRSLCLGFLENDQIIPAENDLAIDVRDKSFGKLIYHINSIELRKNVSVGPLGTLYVQMPKAENLIACRQIPGASAAVLEPDLESLQELANGNYRPKGDDIVLDLDVTRVSGAVAMRLETDKPDYMFDFGKICTRDFHSSKQPPGITCTGFNKPKCRYYLRRNRLQDGKRHAFRLIALDKDGKSCGFYSDTVCIDLRHSAI